MKKNLTIALLLSFALIGNSVQPGPFGGLKEKLQKKQAQFKEKRTLKKERRAVEKKQVSLAKLGAKVDRVRAKSNAEQKRIGSIEITNQVVSDAWDIMLESFKTRMTELKAEAEELTTKKYEAQKEAGGTFDRVQFELKKTEVYYNTLSKMLKKQRKIKEELNKIQQAMDSLVENVGKGIDNLVADAYSKEANIRAFKTVGAVYTGQVKKVRRLQKEQRAGHEQRQKMRCALSGTTTNNEVDLNIPEEDISEAR